MTLSRICQAAAAALCAISCDSATAIDAASLPPPDYVTIKFKTWGEHVSLNATPGDLLTDSPIGARSLATVIPPPGYDQCDADFKILKQDAHTSLQVMTYAALPGSTLYYVIWGQAYSGPGWDRYGSELEFDVLITFVQSGFGSLTRPKPGEAKAFCPVRHPDGTWPALPAYGPLETFNSTDPKYYGDNIMPLTVDRTLATLTTEEVACRTWYEQSKRLAANLPKLPSCKGLAGLEKTRCIENAANRAKVLSASGVAMPPANCH